MKAVFRSFCENLPLEINKNVNYSLSLDSEGDVQAKAKSELTGTKNVPYKNSFQNWDTSLPSEKHMLFIANIIRENHEILKILTTNWT